MRMYLCGPMRGYPDNNAAAFRAAARDLRARGHEVWSPLEHDEKLQVTATNFQIREVFRRDLDALLQQDAVALLPDWISSHGACLERHVADVAGIPVFLYTGVKPNLLCSVPPLYRTSGFFGRFPDRDKETGAAVMPSDRPTQGGRRPGQMGG